jgi:hypothetical protein
MPHSENTACAEEGAQCETSKGARTWLGEALDDGAQRVEGGHHVHALPVLAVGALRRLLMLLVHRRLRRLMRTHDAKPHRSLESIEEVIRAGLM